MSCTPYLYPHNPSPSLLLIQLIHNIIHTIHTKHARTRRYLTHTVLYCIVQSFPSPFSCPISICALLLLFVPFLSLSFFFLSFCLYPISIRCSLPFYSVLFLSSPPCSRFCHPSFDFCSLTLSLSLSLAICFRGIAIIWNPGNAAVQKPRNEAKLAYKESPFV